MLCVFKEIIIMWISVQTHRILQALARTLKILAKADRTNFINLE